MPRFDLGRPADRVRMFATLVFGKRIAVLRIRAALNRKIGSRLSEALCAYERLLETWIRNRCDDVAAAFSAHAAVYRAQLEQLALDHAQSSESEALLRRDLELLLLPHAGPNGVGRAHAEGAGLTVEG